MNRASRINLALCLLALLLTCAGPGAPATQAADDDPKTFTIAVIPDTQNYVNFEQQTEAGFPFDAREMLFDQMAYIARNSRAAGGDIVFASGVGDVWEHQVSDQVDPDSRKLGLRSVPNPTITARIPPTQKTVTIEIPAAVAAYRIIDGKLPFSVVAGNHDYDAMWTDARHPPPADLRIQGGGLHTGSDKPPQLHVGGLVNWTRAFGAESSFFKGKPWYVASFRGGVGSAQVFDAAGHRFLHIGLEMAPDNAMIAWAQSVIDAHRGLPTIISLHDFLDTDGQRKPSAIMDLALVNPARNNQESLWRKLMVPNDQVFLVLSGHEHGASHRVDANAAGHKVYQLLADYQNRFQSLRAVTPAATDTPGGGIGDGWLRLLQFDLSGANPTLRVRTWSTHYKAFANQLPAYAAWYKAGEHPSMTDGEFLAQDEFTLPLDDFTARFGTGSTPGRY